MPPYARQNSRAAKGIPLWFWLCQVRYTNLNIYYAAYAIAGSGCYYFTLFEDLKLHDLSLSLDRVSVNQALQSIAEQIRVPAIVKYDGGVLVVAEKHPSNGGMTNCPPGVSSQTQSKPSPDAVRVTLHAGKIPFLVALARICDQANLLCRFDPEVAAQLINRNDATQEVLVNISHMPVEGAVAYLLRCAALDQRLTSRLAKDPYRNRALIFSVAKPR